MKDITKINWAFAAAVTVSIAWLVGDIYIVGFKPAPQDYPLFSKDYADKVDVELALHMLTGSTGRLMFGALIGALTAPLLLPAMWLVFQFFKQKQHWFSWLTYYALLAGSVLSPLGHASFFFVGEIFKAILHTDKSAHSVLLETANAFTQMLYISWISAVSIIALGWLLFTIGVFMRKTFLPRWFGFFTPILLTFYQNPIVNVLPKSLSEILYGAGFNIAYLLFFLLLLFFGRRKLEHTDLDTKVSSYGTQKNIGY